MEEPKGKYPVRTEGPMYLHQMPTEKIQAELEQLKRKLLEVEAELDVARRERCPDPQCPNCRKWRAWEDRNGDVLWLQCTTCNAKIGKPCRHVGRGVGGGYAPVLKRPHRDRPWVEHPPEDAP